MTYRKKLIEVALPLDAINAESAREKSIRHGHPSTLHLWWARRPLAACRAVLFAQMVDDPSSHPERFPTEAEQTAERERLFDIIRDLVLWENVNNEKVLEKARAEIRKYAPPDGLPPVLDPFAGGGSIPLEAQRLGLEAHASDLNPVAVLINKALIEIPPKFANLPPVNPESRGQKRTVEVWRGAQGLAEDVRYYGRWMRDEAEKRIGQLYPKATITAELLAERPDLKQQGLQAGDELTVIAWLWARTVPSPNPAAKKAYVPLVKSFRLAKDVWIEPEIDREKMSYTFTVKIGNTTDIPKATVNRKSYTCLLTDSPIDFDHVRQVAQSGQMGMRLLATVVNTGGKQVFLSPESYMEDIALAAQANWMPNFEMATNPRHMTPPSYGMTTFAHLFTLRQLVALSTFSDLVEDVRQQVRNDLAEVQSTSEIIEYSDAIATYMAFAVDRGADYWSSLTIWANNFIAHTFGRQALSMVWDFAEANPFSDSTGNWSGAIDWIARAIEKLPGQGKGFVSRANAAHPINLNRAIISTDPPYYDNVPYADISDFFYVWLRRSLKNIDEYRKELFDTLLTPKAEEIVADSVRHGSKQKAETHFERGINQAFVEIRNVVHAEFPTTVYYAFKQTESDQQSIASTGWETMLEGLIAASFVITGTWPIRTERPGRLRETGSNALASSIVLVCRPRPDSAPRATRRDFLNALRRELPAALRDLQHGNIAPVDLAQASIGPGMAIFSRYSQVLEADGAPMRVRTALALINQSLDEYLSEQEGAYDSDTRWALAWFEQNGFNEGPYGDAETLSTAKNNSVSGMVGAGFLHAAGGKVRLLRRDELPADWNPHTDKRPTVWETCQQLIRTMEEKGETAAAQLLSAAGPLGDAARDLAYRLYQICERKGWAQEALPYNALIISWSEMGKLARAVETAPTQRGFEF